MGKTLIRVMLAVVFMLAGGAAFAETTNQTITRYGNQAADALARCQRVLDAWYAQTGRGNMLLPHAVGQRQWLANDNASDMWAHFVNAAWVLGDARNEARVRGTMLDEIRMTARKGRLPDDINIDTGAFLTSTPNMNHIIFGAAEEVKDGLVPIIDLTGSPVYIERARGLVEDIMLSAGTNTRYGKIPDSSAETNGDMLQSLCRLYAVTGDPDYKRWAERIGDAWVFQVMPKCHLLPVHRFNFSTDRAEDSKLQLIDHGNEIIVGLVELLALEWTHDRARYDKYRPAITGMIDKLLDHALNADGVWARRIDTETSNIIMEGGNDTWGYVTNSVYTLYLLTGNTRYRDATVNIMRAFATTPGYQNWGTNQDSYADAIESGILLYNRIPMPEMAAWLEQVVPKFLAMQKSSGMVGETYLDGNYVRTALMWALMKSAGLRATEWRADLRLGAIVQGDKLIARLGATKAWSGLLCFDPPRARQNTGLELDYPRINQYPNWYTVRPEYLYNIYIDGVWRGPMLGQDLIDGLPLTVGPATVQVTIWPRPGPWIK